jgi:SPP1 family predicted phage head-tail adaptor
MSLAAGPMEHRLTFQRLVSGQDAAGQPLKTWENLPTLPTVWGSAQPLRGKEFLAANQVQATAEVKFTIRYRTDLDASMRLLWRGVVYELVAPPIDVNGRAESLELMCVRGRSG